MTLVLLGRREDALAETAAIVYAYKRRFLIKEHLRTISSIRSGRRKKKLTRHYAFAARQSVISIFFILCLHPHLGWFIRGLVSGLSKLGGRTSDTKAYHPLAVPTVLLARLHCLITPKILMAPTRPGALIASSCSRPLATNTAPNYVF
jgi:hypothetical protein